MKKQSKLNKWFFGKNIETKPGYFVNDKMNIIYIIGNGAAIGYVIYGNVNLIEPYDAINHCSNNYSTSLIEELENEGLTFIESK